MVNRFGSSFRSCSFSVLASYSLVVSSLAVASVLSLVACVGDESVPPPAPAPAAQQQQPTPDPTGVGQTPPATPAAPTASNTSNDPPKPPPDIVGRHTFQPTELTGLALWLRTDKGVHVDAKNLVTSWDDQSGKHNDAKPLAAATAPTFMKDKNGMIAVSFDGLQAITIADNASMRWGTDFTIIVVASSNQTPSTYGALYGKTAVAYPYVGPALFTDYPLAGGKFSGAIGGQVDIENFAVSPQVALDDHTLRMFGLVRAGAVITTHVDGETPASHSLAAATDTSATGVDAFIGGHPTGKIVQGFTGEIFEVIGVAGALSDADYQTVYAYAQARYLLK